MFRAKTKDGKEVKGYWCVVEGRHFIIPDDARLITANTRLEGSRPCYINGFIGIDPLTLAQDTTVKDKNETPIYGSFPVDGVMSKGGDRIRHFYNYGRPRSEIIEVKWDRTVCGFGLHYSTAANSEVIGQGGKQ